VAGKRILIVAGTPQHGPLLAAVFTQAGYDARPAPADSVRTAARAWPPDLVVAEYALPGGTGLDLLADLRADGMQAPLVLLAGRGSEDLAVAALRAGASDYVRSPFSERDLLDAADRALRPDWTRFPTNSDPRLQTLDAVLRGTEDAIIVVDEDGRLMFCNPAACRIFSLSAQARLGWPLRDALDHREVVELFEKEARTGHSRRTEISLEDGARWMNVQMTIVPGVGRVAVMQDITHLKELDRVKSDFVTSVSHDLRSPLTAILGYVALLGRCGPLNEQQRQFVERITDSVNSIARLISELLELSRIEAGYDQDREPAALPAIVRQVAAERQHELDAKQQALDLDVADDAPPVLGNPLRLSQLVANLLENAIKYTPARGRIGVALGQEDGCLVLRVSDTGIGIPPEDQPHIFDKFYRGDDAIERYEGTGLGLSIVKGIVEQHDGRIWVESQVGHGSTFTVMLPAIGD